MTLIASLDLHNLAEEIKRIGTELGFQQVGIADIDLTKHLDYLNYWIEQGYFGDMHFFPQRGELRAKPAELVPETLRVISVRMDYLPPDASFARDLADPDIAYISRYALGRDYHKVMRKRLALFGKRIKTHCQALHFRPFVDSAPVLEHALAEKAGIGWTGKHTLTLQVEAGSWFFLGELFINLPLPCDQPIAAQCGSCQACLSICPTNAFVDEYVLDARKCISYLTIEHQGAIPLALRPLMGNRIYGCDDCQLVCPFNQTAPLTCEADFYARPQLKSQSLLTLFNWDEATFLAQTEGTAIRRIGWYRWQRNLSVAIGNANAHKDYVNALQQALAALPTHALHDSQQAILAEHYSWAIKQQTDRLNNPENSGSTRQQARLTRAVRKGLPRDA